jgi:hypothetical protein
LRYVGIALPVVLLLGAALALVFGRARGPVALVLVGGLVALLALGTINKVSDEGSYVLPWHSPRFLHKYGRDYTDPTGCETHGQAGSIKAAGRVYGYLTPSRRFYEPSKRRSHAVPTVVWMQGSTTTCLIPYSLSGGP